MAYTTINKHTDYFDTTLITGNGSTQNITGLGFQPDFIWMKRRNATGHNRLIDAVRGSSKIIQSDLSNAEGTDTTYVSSFNSDGWSIGSNSDVNASGGTAVGWSWKANGAGSANTDGSTNSTVSVNSTSGFSIVKWTGTGSGTTIGHGLGVKPKIIFVKNVSSARNWVVNIGEIMGADERSLYLNANDAIKNDAAADHGYTYNNTTTTFSTASGSGGTQDDVNKSGDTIIAYCFAEKTGFSKGFKWTGNNNADGPFIYCGFAPKFVIWKSTSSAHSWIIEDEARNINGNGYLNGANTRELYPSAANAEATSGPRFDFYSNGLKIRDSSSADINGSNAFIGYAFGQSLVGSNNVPCTAR
tara:strand:+ start:3758 stop:4831 length:1074 start_codon:yes stop_codon:yes gene_type:complete